MITQTEPWSKFYWADWRGDPKLRMCGLAARGLWMEMLAVMHEATPYGHLLVNGHVPTDQQLANMVGASVGEVRKLKIELERVGVPTIEDGIWLSRRMVRDRERREVSRQSGALGGHPKLTTGYNRPGYVYHIGWRSDGASKIGISTDPAKRLYKIRQQYEGEDLAVIDSAFVQDMGAEEFALHRMFEHCRKGEWVNLSGKDKSRLGEEFIRLKANGDVLLKSHDARDPEARSQKPEDANASKDSLESQFEEWWGGFPNKVGKGQARKAFLKALKGVGLETLIAGVATYRRTKPDYADWCHPATWLNGERWNDEVANGRNASADDLSERFSPLGPPPVLPDGWEKNLDH